MNALGAFWTKINNALATVNDFFSLMFPVLVIILFIIYNIYYYARHKKKRDIFYLEITLIFIEILLLVLFWLLPYLLSKFVEIALNQVKLGWITDMAWFSQIEGAIKWALIIAASIGIAHFYGNAYGEKRWLYSAVGHLGIIFFGWLINRWMGMVLLSLPILLTYYSALYILAMVILPTSNPEDKNEKWQRFIVLVSYTWGCQFPIRVVADHAWKKAEIRINGDFARDLPVPGLIWTKSHQVVGVTGGTQFNRVAGPGVIFTGKLEQPLQIIDLRLQLRTNEIDVVSKDGIKFIVRVFTAFRIDPEEWKSDMHAQMLKMNSLLQEADKPSYTTGSFPFSHRRVQATLSTTSAKTMEPDKITYWDQWALNIVNEEARKVVSQKTLDEFWRPPDDKKYANAMSGIAQEIKSGAESTLRSKGILLIVGRIVNFRFPSEEKMDEISKRQITTWSSEWERKRTQKLADAEANSERDQQEARTYAESQLLKAIAEALQKTHDISHELPKHVIATRYLSALQDYAHKNTPEEEEKIKDWHNSMRE